MYNKLSQHTLTFAHLAKPDPKTQIPHQVVRDHHSHIIDIVIKLSDTLLCSVEKVDDTVVNATIDNFIGTIIDTTRDIIQKTHIHQLPSNHTYRHTHFLPKQLFFSETILNFFHNITFSLQFIKEGSLREVTPLQHWVKC